MFLIAFDFTILNFGLAVDFFGFQLLPLLSILCTFRGLYVYHVPSNKYTNSDQSVIVPVHVNLRNLIIS